VATARGLPPYETAVALLKANGGSVGMVGFAMSEENLERILAHPLAMVCSDGGSFAVSGPARRGHPHPRGVGTFARVLARYVRERKALSLGAAIHKMSGLAAQRLRLTGRGMLRVGGAGDVVVFDPATVVDRATFADPFQYAVGISAVFVNGSMAFLDGVRGARTGRAIRVT
jgi:N-acyl-D-aspartate/D-glutamate deacylase